MRLSELRLENLRNIKALQLRPGPGVNLLIGPNGAGKTSILEGIFLLAHGYSFRGGRNEVLLRNGADSLAVYGAVEHRDGGSARVGLSLCGGRWAGRINGGDTASLAALFHQCAVVCFEPGSHALIAGPGQGRRRFLDWGVFHVEPDFAQVARRYRTALRQRNAALRENRSDAELAAWDQELALSAQPLAEQRARYLARLTPILKRLLERYLPDLGEAEVQGRSGWGAGQDLLEALRAERATDRARGHTTRGPHRADWTLRFARAPRREQLSRGQEKLCAIACTAAQAEIYHQDHGEWPIVVLDDLSSELDSAHQFEALASFSAADQIFISSTNVPESLCARSDLCRFHVEQGHVQILL